MAVIGNLSSNDDVGLVPMQRDYDVVGVGVETVPDEFDHRPYRVVLVGELLDVIVTSFESIRRHARILPGGTDTRDKSRCSSNLLTVRSIVVS